MRILSLTRRTEPEEELAHPLPAGFGRVLRGRDPGAEVAILHKGVKARGLQKRGRRRALTSLSGRTDGPALQPFAFRPLVT